MLRLPPALLALLGAALLQSLAWIVLLPPLQGPDEPDHLAYTQRMVETKSIVWRPRGGSTPAGREPYSTELVTAYVWAGLRPLAANTAARPLWTEADEAIWRREDRELTDADRRDGAYGAPFRNPPLYYAYSAIPYAAASGGSILDRAFAMRLANVPFVLLAVGFAWLLAAELLGRRARWLPFAAAAPVALHPQLHHVAATVNPDALLVAEWAAGLYLACVVVRRGPTRGTAAALLAVAACGALTHYRGFPLLAVAAVALGVAWVRRRGLPARGAAGAAAAAAAVGLLALLAVAAAGRGQVREFVSYAWQFYLPKLPFMSPTVGPRDYDVREAWVDRFFGTQLEVDVGGGINTALLVLSLAGLAALAVAALAERAALRRNWPTLAVLATGLVALVGLLHVGAYRGMLDNADDPVFTGRYLLVLLPVFGLAIALVAARAGPVLAGLVVGAALALGVVDAGAVLGRFYG